MNQCPECKTRVTPANVNSVGHCYCPNSKCLFAAPEQLFNNSNPVTWQRERKYDLTTVEKRLIRYFQQDGCSFSVIEKYYMPNWGVSRKRQKLCYRLARIYVRG